MAWIYLLFAGLCEVLWAAGMKRFDGLRLDVPTLMVLSSMATSLMLFNLASKQIPVGVAYAVWTGIGITGVFIYGIFFFEEKASLSTVLFIGLILIGIVGLQLSVK